LKLAHTGIFFSQIPW